MSVHSVTMVAISQLAMEVDVERARTQELLTSRPSRGMTLTASRLKATQQGLTILTVNNVSAVMRSMADSRVPSPELHSLSARPLMATRADMALFAGRDWEVNELERALAQRFSVLVVGDRGSGRTSLLRALMHNSRSARTDVPRMVYVRASGLATAEQLLDRVLETDDGMSSEDSEDPAARRPGASFALAALAERQRVHPMVVLLDDVDPGVGNSLFGVLRDELWETRTTWVVTATRDGSTAILAPPADAFFETILRVDALSEAEAIDLLRRRLPGVDQVRLESIARDGGQPRELLELARQVDWDSKGQVPGLDAARRHWDRALAVLGRPAAMLVAEMRDLGPVSASDEALLGRMGWTRPRALQVLAELEEAGLATSSSPPQAGPGRPKKVYRLLMLPEWAARQDRERAK